MRIKIAERLRPFAHLPGIFCLIPGSTWEVQVFPTLFRFRNLATPSEEWVELKLSLKGPVRDFTLQCDLERGCVSILGFAEEGYLRLILTCKEEGLSLFAEKVFAQGIPLHLSSEKKESILYSGKEKLLIPLSLPPRIARGKERLSLGVHKSQDWELIRRRQKMEEIFPHWLYLSNHLPLLQEKKASEGMFSLLQECEERIASRQKKAIIPSFSKLFQAGFEGILSPRLKDPFFQGLAPEEEPSPSLSSLLLLKKGASLIRSLFFEERGDEIALLPCLPPEFHSGRLIGVETKEGDLIDLEWSKKILRRVVWHPVSEREPILCLQKEIKSFRLRRSLSERGVRLQREERFPLRAKETIYLDCFQK